MNDLANSCRFFGRVGKDPETTYHDNGSVVVNFVLAVTEKNKDKSGNWAESTVWINCTAWGDMAKNIEKNVRKGTALHIHGRYAVDMWEKDNKKNYKTYIRICEFIIQPPYEKRNEVDNMNHM